MRKKIFAAVAAALMVLGGAISALAHCDTMDGPVVIAAKKAFETGNVNHVLIWVQEDDENEIIEAFKNAAEVRKAGGKAKELAEIYFYETLVRIHREGEGAPYTGLKPAGSVNDPVILAADKAVASGKASEIEKIVVDTVKKGLKAKFSEMSEKKSFKTDEVGKGREFVEAYVVYLHYAEGIYKAAKINDGHGTGCTAEKGDEAHGKTERDNH